MKLLKNLFYLSIITLIVMSCNKPERSVGMTTWSDNDTEFKFYLGTENAVNVVKKYDEYFNNSDWNKAIEIFADTAKITYFNGQKVSPQELIEMSRLRDSSFKANNVNYKWNLQNLYSVDIDPTRGGEHVTADYNVTYDDGKEKMQFNSVLRFYVIEDKIIWINQFNQSVVPE